MGSSVLRTTGRMLAPVVAVALLAGVSQEAGAASQGKIVLHLGSANDASSGYFELLDDDNVQKGTQTFSALKGCTFNADYNGRDYVDLVPSGGRNDPNPGFGATSIGVFDGPPGVPCSRIESGKDEALEVALGSGIPYMPPASSPNKKLGFTKLEIDIEAKGDVLLKLETLAKVGTASGTVVLRTYWLRTGSYVTEPVIPDFVANPSQTTFNCRAASDSGSDSFGSDNCMWKIADMGQAFRLTPLDGEVSLESGGDFGSEEDSHRTVIYLGEIDSGTLECSGDTATTFSPVGDYCEVGLQSVSYETSDVVGICSIDYVLAFDGQTCGFYTPPGVQIVANARIRYAPEQALAPVNPPSSGWTGAALSQITFGDKGGPFPIPQCLGLTIDETGNGFGPEPIPEVVADPDAYDLIPADISPLTEFACAYARWERYETVEGELKVFIEEDVQFWSDPLINRGAD
jgi:hypothetical protein